MEIREDFVWSVDEEESRFDRVGIDAMDREREALRVITGGGCEEGGV